MMAHFGKIVFQTTIVGSMFLILWCGVVETNSPANGAPPSDENNYDAWEDPLAMVSTPKKHKNDEQEKQVDKDAAAPPPKKIQKPNNQKNCDLAHFRQLTRIILDAFPTAGKRYATVELSENDLTMLQEFKRNDEKGENLYDVSELITGIFKQMQEHEESKESISAIVAYNKDIFAVVFIATILIFILILFEIRTAMSWYEQFWYLFGFLFITSIPWEWFRLYRKAYAEKQAEFLKDIPSSCVPKNMTIAERLSLWIAGTFTWKSDDCTAFQEAILVDPVWEVSPSLAFSTTITRLFFDPLVYVAHSCGEILQAFLSKVPTMWQPVMVVLMAVIFLLCILMLTKSRIRFGFFEIGPDPVQVRRLEKEQMDALRDCIRNEIRENDPRAIAAPVREGNVEEFSRTAVQEERAQGHDEATTATTTNT